MANTVAQMTPLELRELIEDAVERKFDELLGDPDAGCELREEVRLRLIAQQKEIDAGNYGIPLEDVVRQLGLDT